MEPSVRRYLRWAAWSAFLIGAPLLLLYARGYRLAMPSFRGPLTPTTPAVGALIVRTVPRGAAVALNGQLVDRRTPTGMGNLRAGLYALRIEKQGYRPYEKRIALAGGRVTDLLHVQLIPERIEEEVLRDGTIGIWLSNSQRWALLRERARFRLLPLNDVALGERGASGALSPAQHAFQLPLRRGQEMTVAWSPSDSALAINVRRLDETSELVGAVDVRTGRVRRFTAGERFVGWAAAGPERLLLLSKADELTEVPFPAEPTESNRVRVLGTRVAAAAVHPVGTLFQQRAGAAPYLTLIRGTGTRDAIALGGEGDVRTVTTSPLGDIAVIRGDDGMLVVLPEGSREWQSISPGVRSMAWSPDGAKLLFQQSSFDLWAVNVSEERSSLPRFVPELLVRLTTPLREVRWHPDSQRVTYVERDILQWVEIDPRDGHRIETIASSNRGDVTYVLAQEGDRAWLSARREEQDVLLLLHLRTLGDR